MRVGREERKGDEFGISEVFAREIKTQLNVFCDGSMSQ
jgi:hypothetical protein